MPALAAIHNEGQNNAGCDVQVFYNTQSNNLAMIMKSKGGAKDLNTRYEAPSNSVVGPIVTTSQIAVARVQGMNMVVCFTRKPEKRKADLSAGKPNADNAAAKGDEDDKEWDVSLISPVLQPLTTSTARYSNVALSTKGDDGWVYFLNGADPASLAVYETNLTIATNSSDPIDGMPPLDGTKIAAYYDLNLDQRFVIYQLQKAPNKLYEYNIDEKAGAEITNTGDALKNTVLSVAYLKDIDTVALYYTDAGRTVRKVYKGKNKKWGGSNSITGTNATTKVHEESQLANTTVDNNVHLFWSPNKVIEPLAHNVDKVA